MILLLLIRINNQIIELLILQNSTFSSGSRLYLKPIDFIPYKFHIIYFKNN